MQSSFEGVVVLGSKNPGKLEAVRICFNEYQDLKISSIEVCSFSIKNHLESKIIVLTNYKITSTEFFYFFVVFFSEIVFF